MAIAKADSDYDEPVNLKPTCEPNSNIKKKMALNRQSPQSFNDKGQSPDDKEDIWAHLRRNNNIGSQENSQFKTPNLKFGQ